MDINSSRAKPPAAFSPAVLLILGAILTIAIIAGIKFLVGEDAGESLPQTSGQTSIFRDERPAAGAPGAIPAARSEATSGGSLEIFEKANVGYSSDGSSAAAAALPAPQTEKKPAAQAPVKKKAAAATKKTGQTAIPRIRGIKPFGTSAPDKKGIPGGAGMPDMSEMMKQARQQQENGD